MRAQELFASYVAPLEHPDTSKWCRRNIFRLWLFYSSSESDVPAPAGQLWTSGGYMFVGAEPDSFGPPILWDPVSSLSYLLERIFLTANYVSDLSRVSLDGAGRF